MGKGTREEKRWRGNGGGGNKGCEEKGGERSEKEGNKERENPKEE